MRFSERYGHVAVRAVLQVDSIDEPLRNSLWSVLKIHIWDKVHFYQYSSTFRTNPEIEVFCQRLWFSYYKLPLDSLKDDWNSIYQFLRRDFLQCEWFGVYDFLEFVANNYPYNDAESFVEGCNFSLEREMSAFRLVDGRVVRITADEEIAEIESAISDGRDSVRIHLRTALDFISDRKRPDYRNSIKESISAVESLVEQLLGQKGTLGQLIKKLESKIGLHPALKNAFSSLYGYTSDEGGIRHALMEASEVGFDEAKFFLVACSAFINLVNAKIVRAT